MDVVRTQRTIAARRSRTSSSSSSPQTSDRLTMTIATTDSVDDPADDDVAAVHNADEAASTPVKSNRSLNSTTTATADTTTTTSSTLFPLSTPETHKPDTSVPPRLAASSRASIQRLRRRFRRNDSSSSSSSDTSDNKHHHLKQHRHRARLIQDHYRLDPDRRVVLPGVPRYEKDWARDAHDFFNLIFLVPIIATNICGCWDWDKIFVLLHKNSSSISGHGANSNNNNNDNNHLLDYTSSWEDSIGSISEYWTGEWFDQLLQITVAYFIVDLIWVAVVPHCVKSPATILQHHIATMLYIYVPYHLDECRWCMGACLSVEINTWFLIARRVLNKQGFPPWTIDLSIVSIRVKLISICFYITWIAIRCLLYPALFLPILRLWMDHSQQVGSKWNLFLLCIPLHATFCLLNLKWTYDLLMSKVRYWRRKANRNNQRHYYNNNNNHHSKGL